MPAVIEVQHLHKSYGDTVAVDDVSFTVQEGEIFGILGPNGAGKTTTVESIEGLRTPDRGTISVLGLGPRRDRAELTQRLGAQLQDSQLPDRLQVAEALELYSSFYRAPADWRALMDALGLAGKSKTRFGAAVRRPEAAPVDRARAGREPAGGGAGRADHRPGPAGQAGYLGAGGGAGRGASAETPAARPARAARAARPSGC